MILGTGIFSLLLLLPAAAPPDGPLAEYPIFELDEWCMGDPGGGGGERKKHCTVTKAYGPDMTYCVEYDGPPRAGGGRPRVCGFMTEDAANKWKDKNCD
jgi:hypothetical protein